VAITQPSYPTTTSTLVTHVGAYVDAGDAAVDTRLDAIEGNIATQTELDAHLNDATDAHDASAISFAPTGTISATDAQAAVAEVASEAASALSNHDADTTSVHGIADTAQLATLAVTDALDSRVDTLETDSATTAALTAHEVDTTSVHGISNTAAIKAVALHSDISGTGSGYPARPTGFASVEWIGPTDPGALSVNGDTWVPTEAA